MKIPCIAGEWRVLFRPEKNGNYVNDHTIVCGPDQKWHLYGITSMTGRPSDERYFVHGVGENLYTPFREVGRSIDKGTLAWSPCVIEREQNYYMFYGPSPTSLAVSFDMYEWFGHTVTLQNEPLMAAHRDHFVLRPDNGTYLMYVSGIYQQKVRSPAFLPTICSSGTLRAMLSHRERRHRSAPLGVLWRHPL